MNIFISKILVFTYNPQLVILSGAFFCDHRSRSGTKNLSFPANTESSDSSLSLLWARQNAQNDTLVELHGLVPKFSYATNIEAIKFIFHRSYFPQFTNL